MVVSTASIRLAHVTLYVAGEDVSYKRVPGVALERPGVVLACAQIDLIELVHTLVAE